MSTKHRADRAQLFALRFTYFAALLPFIIGGLVFLAVVALFIAL